MTPDDALAAARAAAAAAEARGETWQGWTAQELEQRRDEAMGFQREKNPGEAERAARNAAENPVPEGWRGPNAVDSLAPHIEAERKAHEKRIAELEAERDLLVDDLAAAYRELADFRAAEEARVKEERERPAERRAGKGVREAARKAVAVIKRHVEQRAGRKCELVWGAPRLEETETLREVAMHTTLLERALADEEQARPATEQIAPTPETARDRPVSERARLIYEGATRMWSQTIWGGSDEDVANRVCQFSSAILLAAELEAADRDGEGGA